MTMLANDSGEGVAGQQGEDDITMKFKYGKSVRRKEGVGTKRDTGGKWLGRGCRAAREGRHKQSMINLS